MTRELPPEVWEQILVHFDTSRFADLQALVALSRCSRVLWSVCAARLYRNLSFRPSLVQAPTKSRAAASPLSSSAAALSSSSLTLAPSKRRHGQSGRHSHQHPHRRQQQPQHNNQSNDIPDPKPAVLSSAPDLDFGFRIQSFVRRLELNIDLKTASQLSGLVPDVAPFFHKVEELVCHISLRSSRLKDGIASAVGALVGDRLRTVRFTNTDKKQLEGGRVVQNQIALHLFKLGLRIHTLHLRILYTEDVRPLLLDLKRLRHSRSSSAPSPFSLAPTGDESLMLKSGDVLEEFDPDARMLPYSAEAEATHADPLDAVRHLRITFGDNQGESKPTSRSSHPPLASVVTWCGDAFENLESLYLCRETIDSVSQSVANEDIFDAILSHRKLQRAVINGDPAWIQAMEQIDSQESRSCELGNDSINTERNDRWTLEASYFDSISSEPEQDRWTAGNNASDGKRSTSYGFAVSSSSSNGNTVMLNRRIRNNDGLAFNSPSRSFGGVSLSGHRHRGHKSSDASARAIVPTAAFADADDADFSRLHMLGISISDRIGASLFDHVFQLTPSDQDLSVRHLGVSFDFLGSSDVSYIAAWPWERMPHLQSLTIESAQSRPRIIAGPAVDLLFQRLPKALRHVHFVLVSLDSNIIKKVFSALPNLETCWLYCHWIAGINDDTIGSLTLPNLVNLKLTGVQAGFVLPRMPSLARAAPLLRSFTLHFSGTVESPWASAITEFLHLLKPTLREVALVGDMTPSSTAGWKTVWEKLAALTALESLHLGYFLHPFYDSAPLVELAVSLPSLRHLTWEGLPLTYQAVVSAFKQGFRSLSSARMHVQCAQPIVDHLAKTRPSSQLSSFTFIEK